MVILIVKQRFETVRPFIETDNAQLFPLTIHGDRRRHAPNRFYIRSFSWRCVNSHGAALR